MRKILPNGKVSGRFIPSFPQQPWQSFNYKQLRLNRGWYSHPKGGRDCCVTRPLRSLVSFTHLQVTHKKTVGNFLSKDFHAKLQILKKLKKWVSCGCILSHFLILFVDTSQSCPKRSDKNILFLFGLVNASVIFKRSLQYLGGGDPK